MTVAAQGGAPPADRLGAGEVHVWVADPAAAVDPTTAAALAALLSPEERTRHAQLRHEGRRREFLVAHALARAVLSRHRPVVPADWRFALGPHGKPEPTPPCGLSFSLTHCDGLVGCALAAGPVGIDAEPLDRALQVLRLAPRFCAPAEQAACAALPAALRAARALVLWTLKEAYAKALGLGMTLPFQSLSFEVEGDADRLQVRLAGPAGAGAGWQLRTWVQGGHQLALAVAQDAPLALRVRRWPGMADR